MDEDQCISRERRITLHQEATLIDSAGTNYPAMLTDLSSGGFKLECGQLLRVGEYIVITSGRDRPQRGQIRWADGHMAGGMFLDKADGNLD